ncbi:MAG: response regulator, partial [Opitutaceae bacterium]|nr:response regulator [Verrucomicrobiales bacterium]
GDILLTSRLRLVQGSSPTLSDLDYGIVTILPVYQHGQPHRTRTEREKAFRGFIQAVFRLHDMMEAGFKQIPAKAPDVLVIDQKADPTNRFLHFHSSEMRSTPARVPDAVPFNGYLARNVDWRIGGHIWTYSFRPCPEWLASQRSWTPEITLFGGILLTLSLTALVNVMSRRTMVVERLVDERTGELSDANIRLESEVQHRKKTEVALRRSETSLKAAQRIAGIGSWESTHPDGAVSWSDETYQIFGMNPGLHRPSVESFFASVHPDDRARVQSAVAVSIASGKPYSIEHRIFRPDGSIRHVGEHAEVEKDAEGRVAKLHGTVQDITERKQSEAEQEALDHKIRETQKLESLGVLAGGIAHDFNNLLTVILGNASLARMDLPPGSPVQANLQQIEQTSQRAAELCRQMLAYSGKGKFVVHRIDLSELIEDTTPLLRLSVSKNAVLRFELARGLPAVLVDVTQIRQIVMNLVINASDALGDQTGVISVSTGQMRASRQFLSESRMAADLPVGDYVFLEISDSGCGMSAETLARIFDPFFTTKFTGRGLGLAATLGIVRGHKGTIHVTSEPGRGATFKLLLPAADGALDPIDQAPSREDSWLGTGTILVVDDEETVRTVAARMVESFGFKVVLASDGREAVALFAEEPARFAAVLLDLTMPQMGGNEAFRAMRQLREDVQVILMSGFNEPEAATRLKGEGWAAFVQKPFAIETLREVLRSLPKN